MGRVRRSSLQPRLDLGIRQLLPQWKAMFTRTWLANDLAAGLTVACIAVPLSLAIALASGVAPAVGLVTAIVAGIVCALFGGTPLQVSGPAAAMVVLVASIVQEHGIAALLFVGIGCGVLQLLFGVFRLGRFIRMVPLPVIEGFTAGIGAIILLGQLPRALGLPAPTQSHVFDVVTHIGELIGHTKPAAVGIALVTLIVVYGLPKWKPRIPAHLIAVVLATVLVAAIGLDAETIGTIPRSLPTPAIPAIPANVPLAQLFGSTLVVFALASLETLLSASVVDRMARGARSDPDQELIGQGLGNIASALFGGIPVTGVVARSAMNVQAGAKTRRASIIHSLVLLLTVLFLARWMERIPIAALAAILLAVAARMLSPAAFRSLWKHSRGDGTVFLVTFATIVFVDLLEGIQWGVVAALAIAAVRLGRPGLMVRGARLGEHYVFALEGPLMFVSSLDIEALRDELSLLNGRPHGEGSDAEPRQAVVFDLRRVPAVDASGADMLAALVHDVRARGLDALIMDLDPSVRGQFVTALGPDIDLDKLLIDDERTLAARLGVSSADADRRLRTGVERYRSTVRPRYASLFEKLASGQSPHTLFIACSDSRLDPNLITSTDPGELFVVRDVGNLVPPADQEQASAVGGAIDFAVGVLGVAKIVVCGHSGCGAIKALLAQNALPAKLKSLEAWLEATQIRPILQKLPKSLGADEVAKLNVLAQLDHLRTYPIVAEKLEAGELSLAAWFFDVARGEVEQWSDADQRFVRVGDGPEMLATPPLHPAFGQ
jgi:carbonic anhydrase